MSAAVAEAESLDVYLRPTFYLDSDDAGIRAFAAAAVGDATAPIDKAVRLYYAVRDQIVYDPYSVEMQPQAFRASDCLAKGRGFCIFKAGLLAAAGRAVSVPARVGFADVKNHLVTARLQALMKTDVFHFHGYSEFFLEGRWVKATPAFNIELCEKFRVLPLEFDGRQDSIFHPFDADGRRHMEYVAERGAFADMPFEEIRDCFLAYYPKMFAKDGVGGDFAAEAAAENR
jgi:transglutaminase-like putative cysteine protease